ncbi:MAG: hypothetical protein WA980_20575 [Shinella zoogloeoides]|uniref:hypothetical protein n=1 Tax=Shinella zoogloeoides TaxID=352475 RepID=UPI003C74A2FE
MSEQNTRDLKFRHELYPGSAALLALSEDITASVLNHEQATGRRQRHRRKDDLNSFRNAVAVIVANLAYSFVFPGSGSGALILPLGHPRSTASLTQPGFGKALKSTIDALEAIGILHLTMPDDAFHAATVAPSEVFRREVFSRGVGHSDDFLRRQVLDPICMTRRDAWKRRHPCIIPVSDDAARYREEVRRLNAWLADADLSYVGADEVDTGDRLMRRHFSLPSHVKDIRLAYGGRFFGGFWQPMRKQLRRHIRIDGEEIAELDYGQILPRLAYGLVGTMPPRGDLYGFGSSLAGNHYRPAVKKALNAMLFSSRPMRAWPLEIADGLPHGVTVGKFRAALIDRHPALAPLLECGVGYDLMFQESEVIGGVLRCCMDQGITALPIHDAVLCATSSVSAVQTIMLEQSRLVSGHSIPVGVEVLEEEEECSPLPVFVPAMTPSTTTIHLP